MKWIYNKEDYLLIIRELGVLLMIVSVVLLFPIFVASIYGESQTYGYFLKSAAISAVLGIIFRFFPARTHFQRKHAIGLVVLAWPLVSIPSALPFYFSGTAPTFLDGYFEAISGWTTTGLTTIGANADVFYHSINFWRHLMQYLGGLGIIVMGIVVLAPLRDWEVTTELAVAAGKKYRIVPSLNNTIKIIVVMYSVFLLIGSLLFYFSGLSVFDSVCHAMAGLSTGGFSTRGASLGAYNSGAVTLVSIPIMIIGGTNFVLVYYLFSGDIKNYLEDIETKVFWSFWLLFVGSLIIWFALRHVGYSGLLDIIFMVTSALTTTGWSTIPSSAVFLQWAPLPLIAIIVSMLIGANASSTGGGIKAFRVGVMLKNILWMTKDVVMPDSMKFNRTYKHIEKKSPDDEELQHIMTFILLYFLILFVSFVIFTAFDFPIITSFYEVTSAIGTVGLSSGITSAAINPVLKIVLCVDMWLGRIEILPILYFIRYIYSNKKRF